MRRPFEKTVLTLAIPTFFAYLTFLDRLECLTESDISDISWQSFVALSLTEWSESNLLVSPVLVEK
jgi:hypothetical protein